MNLQNWFASLGVSTLANIPFFDGSEYISKQFAME